MNLDDRFNLACIILGVGLIGLAVLLDINESQHPKKDWKPRVPPVRPDRFRDQPNPDTIPT